MILLQAAVAVYSLTGITAKLASGQPFLSPRFIFYYFIELCILGVYAVLWQQVIARMDISVAYASRAVVLLWGLVWGVLLFGDSITPKKALGVLLVLAGVLVIHLPACGAANNAAAGASDEAAGREEAAG